MFTHGGLFFFCCFLFCAKKLEACAEARGSHFFCSVGFQLLLLDYGRDPQQRQVSIDNSA